VEIYKEGHTFCKDEEDLRSY